MSDIAEQKKEASSSGALLTDEMLEFERRSTLSNAIREEFFGGSLEEAEEMLQQLKREQDAEFALRRKELKDGQLNELNDRAVYQQGLFDTMTELLGKLRRGEKLDHQALGDFGRRLTATRLDPINEENRVDYGPAEKRLGCILSSVGRTANDRLGYEVKNQYNVPFEQRIRLGIWQQNLKNYFRQIDDPNAPKYGDFDVNKHMQQRVAQAVTAIYSGKLQLPGLQIGDYLNDPYAPHKTAKDLVNAFGAFAFLDYDARRTFIPPVMRNDYDKGTQYAPKEQLDDILLNGNYNALKTLKSGTHAYDAVNTGLQTTFEDGTKTYLADLDKHAAYLDENFKELQQIRKNTEEFGTIDLLDAAEKKKREEKKLYDETLDKYIQEQFDKKVETFWGKLHVSKDFVDETILEQTIAAHLCSAHESYRENDDELGNNQPTDVLTLYHQPLEPITQASIDDTIDYFKRMCAGNSKALEALKKVDSDRIRLYYDSDILNREAKTQEKGLSKETPKHPNFESYLFAMSSKFGISEEFDFSNSFGLDYAKEYGKNLVGYQPTMISRMNYKPGENPWYEYVKSLIQTNKDFANAVREKIKLPDSEPTVSNLTNDFIKYSEHLYHNDSDRPNLESHKAKVAEWETMKQEPLPDLSASTLKSIEGDVKNERAYKDEMRKINDKYVKLFDSGRLTDPEKYNRLPPLEPGIKEKLIEKGQQIIATQQKKSAELSRIFSDCLDSANQVKPGCTRKEMLDMMLLTLGDASNPTEAKKKIMNSSKEIKRNFFFSWFGLHRNPASTRLRTLLGGLAAKPDKAEISPNELMDLHNAAKDLKFSLDHGNTLTPEEVKKLSGIDQRRYALANKVQTAVEQQLYKDGENVLFTKEAEKLPTLSDLNLSDSALKM